MNGDYGVGDPGSMILRLREDLVLAPRDFGDRPGYLIEDSARGRFFRIGLAEFTLVSLLDGRTTLTAAMAHAARRLGSEALDEVATLSVARWLIEMDLAQSDASSQPTRLWRAAERFRKQRRVARLDPLAIRISLGNPDRALTAALPWLGWLMGPVGLAFNGVLFACALYVLLRDWPQLCATPLGIFSVGGWMQLAVAWILLKAWHELFHALAAKRYGARVTGAGMVLMCLAPVPFVDVTNSWRLASKWQRICTAAAGMYGESIAGSVALLAWSRLPEGAARHLAYSVMLMATLHTIVFNANPLMRFDGYYILSDLWGIPNLYGAAMQRVQALAGRLLLGITLPLPEAAPRRARWMTGYGIAALVWRAFVYLSFACLLTGWLSHLGTLIAIALPAIWLSRPAWRLCRWLSPPTTRSLIRMRRVAMSTASLAAGGVMLAIFVSQPGIVSVPAVVEYAPLTTVRAASPGFVREVRVQDGQRVAVGEVIAVLENDELLAELTGLQLEARQAEIQSRVHHRNHELAKYQTELARFESLEKKVREAQERVDDLVVRAGSAGRLIARDCDTWPGRFFAAGDELGIIGDESSKELRLAADHEDVDLLAAQVGQPVGVQLSGARRDRFDATLERVEPHASLDPPHAALAAHVGGPVATKLKPRGADEEAPTGYELLRPAYGGVVPLDAAESRSLHAGQLARIVFRSPTESIAVRLRRQIGRWIAAQIERGETR